NARKNRIQPRLKRKRGGSCFGGEGDEPEGDEPRGDGGGLACGRRSPGVSAISHRYPTSCPPADARRRARYRTSPPRSRRKPGYCPAFPTVTSVSPRSI